MSKKNDADSFFSFRENESDTAETSEDDIQEHEDFSEEINEEDSFLDEEIEESDNEQLGDDEEDNEEFSKDDPKGKRFEHWHSLAEKRNNQIRELEKKLSEYEAVVPIAEYLKQNPQALDKIEEYAKGTSQPNQKLPEKPTRPSKPKDFSYLEAEENPGSASGKYLQELEQYQDALADYYAHRDEMRENKVERIYREVDQRTTQQKLHQQYMEKLQKDYGFSAEKASAFVIEMDKPGSINLDFLVDYWEHKHTSNESKIDNSKDEKARMLREKAKKKAGSKLPPTGGAGAGDKSDGDTFVMGLKAAGRNLFEIKK